MKISSEFGAACAILGLSATDVAEALSVRHDTARSWIGGRRNPPPAAWKALAKRYSLGIEPEEEMIQSALSRLRSA